MNYSFDWVKTIYENEDCSNKKRFIPYPLQFANCKRLEYNDDIYIFDEVGTGKTISSGLMAMHYVYNRNRYINLNYLDVLVVTDYRMVDIDKSAKQNKGKFINDWKRVIKFDKLKLSSKKDYDFENRVQIINIYNSRISDYKDKKIGLLIIDEAHRFMQNDDREYSKMYSALKELAAEKVVCMTATPIRYSSHGDIDQLIWLANTILCNYGNRNIDITKKCAEYKNIFGNTMSDLICAKFDYKYPITRYFKDTVKALRYGTFKKTKSKRYEPIKWSVAEDEKKSEALVKHINDEILKNPDSRFLVFVREISEEEIIEDELKRYNYIEYSKNQHVRNSFWLANSKNKEKDGGHDVTEFEEGENIPSILVVTSGLVEAGVSLPGYNYVINYSISSLPASIEQRLGRIDRIDDSKYEDIKNVFLINSHNENDLKNFRESFDSFYNQLKTGRIPSKNIIFNRDTLTNLKNYQIKELENIKYIFNSDLKDKYDKLNEGQFKCCYGNIIKPRIKTILNKKNSNATFDEFEKSVTQYIDKESERIRKKYDEMICKFHNDHGTEYESDKILYCNADGELCTIDAIAECAELIKGGENYMKYLQEYKSEIDLYEKFKEDEENKEIINYIESKIESIFKNNAEGSELLFLKDENGTIKMLNDIVDDLQKVNVEKGKRIEYGSYNFIKWNYTIIPFYKMCENLTCVIRNEYVEKYPEMRKEYVSEEELETLKKDVLFNDKILSNIWDLLVDNLKNENIELSDAFKSEYFDDYKIKELSDLFYLFVKYDEINNTTVIDTSPWFKLIFGVTKNIFNAFSVIDCTTYKEMVDIRNNYFKFIFCNLEGDESLCTIQREYHYGCEIFINKNIEKGFKQVDEVIANLKGKIEFTNKETLYSIQGLVNGNGHIDDENNTFYIESCNKITKS